ncbi:NGG1 interacting factor [Desmophyllum pertusum]|uniref:NIF3-like protein 1 n=1 Tax=Desmophyllum pertusum TaxID=174260 RepID=A0A9X0CGZ4_9CNID|nr:NGG1 interacting factor [Desmophyllum pertusum]
MDLKQVVTKLNGFASLELAEKWDNVGLLVEPSPPHSVKSILLTNDLTERVVQEAIDKEVNMVISYHPPIFVPLKRLTSGKFKERIIVKMIENRIAVYSPHTAFDAVKNGVNDWLASGLGSAQVEPLEYSKGPSSGSSQYKLLTSVLTNQEADRAAKLQDSLKGLDGVERIQVETTTRPHDSAEQQISIHCSESGLVNTLQMFASLFPEAVSKTEVLPLVQIPLLGTGQGRLCTLNSSVTLSELINRVKSHLNLKHVRLAVAHNDLRQQGDPLQSQVQTIALCAGSGASVLCGEKADVYLTGEMSHHEVLDAVSHGVHVILCEHSNTERGFLTEFKSKLNVLLEEKVDVLVSSCDADPLQVL